VRSIGDHNPTLLIQRTLLSNLETGRAGRRLALSPVTPNFDQ
jgi:hypothetical protein